MKKTAPKGQLQIRVSDETETRIEKYRRQLEKETSGLEVSFSSAARSLLEKGLEAVKL